MLLEHNADVNIQDLEGATPLHLTVDEGNEAVVAMLLEHRADINIEDNDGYTPLYQAFAIGNVTLVELLIEHNEDASSYRTTTSRPPLIHFFP